MNKIPESINFHITQKCNYTCKFCFAKYKHHSRELSLHKSLLLINELAENGCKKLNFAGGEPTLIPILPKLIKNAKERGLFISLISNGFGITKDFLKQCGKSTDLIGLSIDSNLNNTEITLGRTLRNSKYSSTDYSHVDLIKNRAKLIHSHNIHLKINTIVTPVNWNEDISELILELNPIRWKVLEVHCLYQINDNFVKQFGILEDWQFKTFIDKHRFLNPIIEASDTILDSYCMITPDGRFYQDSDHYHHYSQSILEVGILEAFKQVQFSIEKYRFRNAEYFKTLI